MADDIVTRLRRAAIGMPQDDMNQAAAGEIERLRAGGDAIVAVMQSGSDAGWDAAIDAWQEARRG